MKDEQKRNWRWVVVSGAILAFFALSFYSLFLPDKTLFNILELIILAGFITGYFKTYSHMVQRLKGDDLIVYRFSIVGIGCLTLTRINDLLFHVEVPPTIVLILFVIIILASIPAILIYGRNRDQRKHMELASSLQQLKQTDMGGSILAEAKAEPLYSEQLKADKVKEQS